MFNNPIICLPHIIQSCRKLCSWWKSIIYWEDGHMKLISPHSCITLMTSRTHRYKATTMDMYDDWVITNFMWLSPCKVIKLLLEKALLLLRVVIIIVLIVYHLSMEVNREVLTAQNSHLHKLWFINLNVMRFMKDRVVWQVLKSLRNIIFWCEHLESFFLQCIL